MHKKFSWIWTLDSTCQRWKRLFWTKSAKTSLCDSMGVHQCSLHGWSAYMWRYHWCGGLCWNFGETYAAIKMMTLPRNFISISTGQCQASQITTVWLHRHRVCVCLTGLPAVQICLLLKMYGASSRGESDNGDHRLLSIDQEWAKICRTDIDTDIFSSQTKCN